jgi:hypothetical protein
MRSHKCFLPFRLKYRHATSCVKPYNTSNLQLLSYEENFN